MTKGLQKARQRKSSLYVKCLKIRTSENERNYEIYKTQLTRMLRKQKKHYYTQVT